jgi:integrase
MDDIIRKNGKKYSLKTNTNRFLFPEEWLKIEKNLKPKQKHAALCQLNTGARINEIRHIKKEDINFQDSWIILRVTKTKARKGEKIGKPRYVKISSKFLRYLTLYFKHNDSIAILSTPAYNTGLKKASAEAGIVDWPNISSHTIRKTIETWLLALGIDSLKILVHFGHDSTTAAQHYVNTDIFTMEQKWKMREIIGDLYQTN